MKKYDQNMIWLAISTFGKEAKEKGRPGSAYCTFEMLNGRHYVVLRNAYGFLAVYVIREIRSRPMLKRIKRITPEMRKAFS